jgi:hypothetical protein
MVMAVSVASVSFVRLFFLLFGYPAMHHAIHSTHVMSQGLSQKKDKENQNSLPASFLDMPLAAPERLAGLTHSRITNLYGEPGV